MSTDTVANHDTEAPDVDAAPFAAGNSNELDGLTLTTSRRWPYVVLGIAVGIAASVAAAALTSAGSASDDPGDVVEATLATAPVTTQDLVEEVEWVADLGYGEAIEVAATADATVTSASPAGELLERGEIAYGLDTQPVALFYGELPFWRDLAEGSEGPDVEVLETNLVALGYDKDTTVTIDDSYTANTRRMVERWQEDIGAEATGELCLGDAVVVPGPVSVSSIASVGGRVRAGEVITDLSPRSTTVTVVGQTTGTVDSVAEVGTAVEHGTVLYETDLGAVQAVIAVDSVAEVLLDPESDGLDLEETLAATGYDADGELLVDGVLDEVTESAVVAWQTDNGLSPSGRTTADGYVRVGAGLDVVAQLTKSGTVISAARPVLLVGTPTLSVLIPVGLADQGDFFVGQDVRIELPDESEVDGVITDVGTVSTATEGGESLVDVTAELTEFVDDDLAASEVTVIVAGDTVTDAMVVPSRALLTLTEGGFAVEKVVDDGTTVLVAVEPGAFDDGLVEVSSGQLAPGDDVVVPQ